MLNYGDCITRNHSSKAFKFHFNSTLKHTNFKFLPAVKASKRQIKIVMFLLVG